MGANRGRGKNIEFSGIVLLFRGEERPITDLLSVAEVAVIDDEAELEQTTRTARLWPESASGGGTRVHLPLPLLHKLLSLFLSSRRKKKLFLPHQDAGRGGHRASSREGGGERARGIKAARLRTDLQAAKAVHLAILVASLVLDRALVNYASKAALLTRGHPTRIDGAPQVPQRALSVHLSWGENMAGVSHESNYFDVVHHALFSPCIADLFDIVLSNALCNLQVDARKDGTAMRMATNNFLLTSAAGARRSHQCPVDRIPGLAFALPGRMGGGTRSLVCWIPPPSMNEPPNFREATAFHGVNFHRKTYTHQCNCFEGSPHMSPATPDGVLYRQRRSRRSPRAIFQNQGGAGFEPC
jgi:hypothetical protein